MSEQEDRSVNDADRKAVERELREQERREEASERRWRTLAAVAGLILAFVGGMQFPTDKAWITGVAALCIGAILLIASVMEELPWEDEDL